MWQADLAAELIAAETRNRAAIVERYQQLTGLSDAQLYRIAKKHGFKSMRKERTDKGARHCGITDDQLTFIAGVIYKTGRENKGPIMPIETAMEIAEDNGIIEPGQVSAGTLARLMRDHQMSKDRMNELTPSTEMRSLHPNYCHLVDVSVCIQYYLKNGRLGIMDERDFYKNKPDAFAKVKQKLLRYVLDDHFSGFFVFRYYIADGESRANLWDFLKWAWRAKDDIRLAFHGVPFYLLMDAGSAQQSHAMQSFFNGLKIVRPKGKPYNPRRQGAVETVHNIIESRFETRLRICPAHSVEELNAWAIDFTIFHHATKLHSRHGMTRLASWLLIQPEQLREMPDNEVLNLIYREPEKECTVRDYLFSYQGETFRVKHLPNMHNNAKVMVSVNPYRWKEEQVVTVVWHNTPYEVQAVRKLSPELGGFSEHSAIIGQEYKSQPQTDTQRAIKQIDLLAHGGREPKKGDVPFEGLTVFGHQADKVGKVTPLRRPGTPIEITRNQGPSRIPVVDLFKMLRDAGITITPPLNQALRKELGDTVEIPRADEIVKRLAEGDTIEAILIHPQEVNG